jgi:hypothetical protein
MGIALVENCGDNKQYYYKEQVYQCNYSSDNSQPVFCGLRKFHFDQVFVSVEVKIGK